MTPCSTGTFGSVSGAERATWYMVVGAHDYGTSGRPAGAAYTWTSATILIPFQGTTQDIVDGKMLDPQYWGDDDAIRPLKGAPSFDVNYFLDEDSGQGYWVMPRSAGLEVLEAVTAEGEFPALDGTPSRIKDLQWPFEYGVWDGSITGSNPEGNDQGIIEGPFTFTHGEFHYLIYSGATVDKYYNLAVMRAEVGSDVKDPDSWTVQPFSAFNAYDTHEGDIGGAAHVGGGHNSVVVDEQGNLVLVYHARPYPDPHAGQPGAGGLFDPDRHTSVKAINVRANGYLALDITAAQELADEFRTVTAVVTITGGTEPTGEPTEEPTPTQPTHWATRASGPHRRQAVAHRVRHGRHRPQRLPHLHLGDRQRLGVQQPGAVQDLTPRQFCAAISASTAAASG